MTNFKTIELDVLSSVTGGIEASGEVTTPAVTVKGSVKTDPAPAPAPPQAPDPEKQLRCYQQVASQATLFQSSNRTLRQQLQLCGPLRP